MIAEIVGAECWLCGYGHAKSAMHCHHIDPSLKAFNIGHGFMKPMAVIQAEAKKCALLCANCHCEVHEGLIKCPTARPLRLVGSLA